MEKMQARDGERVVSGKRKAPSLWVEYKCPKCEVEGAFDAYDGPPQCTCSYPYPFMTPIQIHEAK